jgi:hypothetical protein
MKWYIPIVIFFALSVTYVAPANAQGSGLNILCEACRDPERFPRDYRNFAYNQVFGPEGWMTYDQGDFFSVTNLRGDSVSIDMNLELLIIGIPLTELGLPFDLGFPVGLQVQIILIFENGDQISYMMDPRATRNRALPVGRRGSRGGGGPGGGSGHGRPADPLPGSTPDRRCGITTVDGRGARRTCI